MDNNYAFSRPCLLVIYERAIITLVIGSRWKSTRHRGNLWRRKTYRPLIALIDNHSKDAARFWGSALFSFQFLPLSANLPVRGQMVYDAVLSLSLSLYSTYLTRLFMPPSFLPLLLILLLRHRFSWLWEIAMIEHVNVWFGLYQRL